jgi:protein arginine kinase activator
MKCEACGLRPAVIFVQQIRGDSRVELRLCAECAKERGIDKDGNLAASLARLMAAIPDKGSAAEPVPPRVCPECGSTAEDIRRTGTAGCRTCWEVFSAELLRIAYPKPGKLRHAGRLPAQLETYRTVLLDLAGVREHLRTALEAEDYETAAACRDRIRELEKRSTRHA